MDTTPAELEDWRTVSSEQPGVRAASILIVDDEPGMRNFLQKVLGKEYSLVEAVESADAAEALRQRCHFDLFIVDIRLPGRSGLDWLTSLREQGVRTEAIFITGYADMDTALGALRAGASDFILKPFRIEQIANAVRQSLERSRMLRENFVLRRQCSEGRSTDGIIGRNNAIEEMSQIVSRVAVTGSTILVEGETGTGKELVARAIHRISGRTGPFVAVNCGSISPELLESELFGHTRGAFTGAHTAREGLFSYAHEGTIFLDEIGEMPGGMQAKLLRVLEEKKVRPVGSDKEIPVNSRVIAATNRRLAEQVDAGRFREDLYYRLNVIKITVPPLRDRVDDIPVLANYFSDMLSAELGLTPIPFSHEDFLRLQAYDWPGNVRELRNVIERSLILGKLPQDCCQPISQASEGGDRTAATSSDWTIAAVEKHHMLQVLSMAGGNKSEAARRLGVSRKTLERKLNEWNRSETGSG